MATIITITLGVLFVAIASDLIREHMDDTIINRVFDVYRTRFSRKRNK